MWAPFRRTILRGLSSTRPRIFTATLAGLALGLSGCAKDRSLEDYHRDQVYEELAKIKTVAGTYEGTLGEGANAEPILMQIDSDTQLQTSNGGITTLTRAGIKGRIVSTGANAAEIIFNNAFYDPDSGYFKAAITIPSTAAPSDASSLSLSGRIEGATLIGRLENSGYPDRGRNFSLHRSQASLEQFLEGPNGASRTELPPEGQIQKFRGPFRAAFGALDLTTDLTMSILLRGATLAQNFASRFTPERTVAVILDFGDTAQTMLEDARLDERSGTLLGRSRSTVANNTFTTDLNCRRANARLPARPTWNCQVTTRTGTTSVTLEALQ